MSTACNPATSSLPTMARCVIRSSSRTSLSWIMCCLACKKTATFFRAGLRSAGLGSIGTHVLTLVGGFAAQQSPADQAHVVALRFVAEEAQDLADDAVAALADHERGRGKSLAK